MPASFSGRTADSNSENAGPNPAAGTNAPCRCIICQGGTRRRWVVQWSGRGLYIEQSFDDVRLAIALARGLQTGAVFDVAMYCVTETRSNDMLTANDMLDALAHGDVNASEDKCIAALAAERAQRPFRGAK